MYHILLPLIIIITNTTSELLSRPCRTKAYVLGSWNFRTNAESDVSMLSWRKISSQVSTPCCFLGKSLSPGRWARQWPTNFPIQLQGLNCHDDKSNRYYSTCKSINPLLFLQTRCMRNSFYYEVPSSSVFLLSCFCIISHYLCSIFSFSHENWTSTHTCQLDFVIYFFY